jgi:predicted dehydrogenase
MWLRCAATPKRFRDRRAMARTLRVAVLGTGGWARQYHLPCLKRVAGELELEIAGLWNRSVETAELAAREFGVACVYPTLAAVLDDKDVDCFVVIVSSSAVLDVVSRLARRGLPIFAEKPPGRTYAEAQQLAGLVNVPNVVAFNRRYMPINRRFKELVDGLGDAYFAECHFYRNDRRIEHFVVETGIHGINYMEYLFGPIRAARTEKRRLSGEGTAGTDWWTSALDFESGRRALMKFLPCCGASVERYEVHGEQRSLYLYCPQSYTSDHPGKIEIHEKGRVVATLVDEEADELDTLGLVNAYRDFFAAVRIGSPTVSNFANACNALRIAEAIEAADLA